jgi:small subunit ribosomal protein S1
VLDIDLDQKRISLGMRQLEQNPWVAISERYPVGTIVRGKVRNITDFGIFIGIEEGIDGLVHISDMSWGQRVRHPSERFQKGDEVEARVLNVDVDAERFSLGIKQLSDDPWLTVPSRFFLGQVITGKIVHKADFGVFVELEDGVEGLVHHSELLNGGADWQSRYEDGQELNAEIINIDAHDRKVSLSEKSAAERAQGGDVREILRRQGDSSARLGDIMGDLSKRMRQRGE